MNSPEQVWRRAFISIDATIGQAIQNLNESGVKIVMVVNEVNVLGGTISDGDIRRGLLKGFNLNSPLSNILHQNVLVVPPDLERSLVTQLMIANKIQQIPIVNEQRQVIGLHIWDEIILPLRRPNLMVIMAGGMGMRLRPHTDNCPKPMLLIAGKPMLEHIIERAKSEGFDRFVIAVHYLGHKIKEYFGDGERLSVKIDYLCEKFPLGTAGALSLLKQQPDDPFVVTNGDVISDIRYGDILDFHCRHSADATMAIRVHEWQHPFGVVQTKGLEIIGFEEKPIARSHINAGVYVLSPSALNILSPNSPFDMPALFDQVRVSGGSAIAYPMHELWLDVGRPDDLIAAQAAALEAIT